MSQKRLLAAAAIIGCVIILGFVLSVPHTRDLPRPVESEKAIVVTPSVVLHDTYKKGVHMLTGSLMAPNACAQATAQASVVNASSTPGILVAVSLPDDTDVCLQVPTRATFSVTVTAPAGLPLSATVNGAAATITGA